MHGRLCLIRFFGILFPVAYSPIHGTLLNLIGHKVFYSAPNPPPIFPRHIFSKTFFKACRLLRINKHDTLQPKQKMGKPERNAFFYHSFALCWNLFYIRFQDTELDPALNLGRCSFLFSMGAFMRTYIVEQPT